MRSEQKKEMRTRRSTVVLWFLFFWFGWLGPWALYFHFFILGKRNKLGGRPIFRQSLSFLSSSLTLTRLFALSNLSLSPLCGCTQWQRESERVNEREAERERERERERGWQWFVLPSMELEHRWHTFRQTYTNIQKKRRQMDQSRPWHHGDLLGLVGVHSNRMERRKRVERALFICLPIRAGSRV